MQVCLLTSIKSFKLKIFSHFCQNVSSHLLNRLKMIGNKIRNLRGKNNILLRQLAAQLDIDTAMLSKMERGDRFFRKDDITALAKIFKQSEKDLFTLWLADKIL